jgi:large subunit ribosomal protein L24
MSFTCNFHIYPIYYTHSHEHSFYLQGPGKKWEHYDLTPNGKPVRVRMHVKSGDMVQVISGHDKGKVGKITMVNTKTGEVAVEGVNIKTKHVKPTAGEEEGGQIVKKEYPVHHSNVQHYSESAQTTSRIGRKVENGKKVRFLKKTGEVIDKE